ncbi:hypothetical protein OQI_36565, partial [Streptomyces pharetrae CZA14]
LRDDVLCPCYGMAEATVFVSGAAFRKAVVTTVDVNRLRENRFVPAESGADLVGCGVPRDCDLLIVDPRTGEPLQPGGIGEIWLRGPSVGASYWGDTLATERAFVPGGYLRTGDLGTLHDGELYVTGRLAETVTVYGHHLYPQDIERRLREHHPELASVGAAFTVPLARPGAEPEEVLVVTHEVTGRPAEEVLRRLADGIKETVDREFGVPVGGVALLRRGAVRRTTSGKIQRVAMRGLFLDGELSPLHADYEPPVTDALRAWRLSRPGRER